MKWERAREGWLLVDHTAGDPGPSMLGPGTRRGKYESATVTCSHCNNIVVLRPDRSRKRERCFKCDRYICDGCVPAYRFFGCQGSLAQRMEKEATKIIRSEIAAKL